jgi:acetyl-CoA C-acetyltransferase
VTAAGEAACDGLDRELINQVIVGQVLAAGHGMNVARQAALSLGFRESSTAMTVNMMCGSGLKALALGVQAIRAGETRAVLAGGVESMSQSPLLVQRPGRGQQPDLGSMRDSMVTDGLRDVWIDQHMGDTAERLAREFGITRAEQDAWALRSQSGFAAAQTAGDFSDELVSVGEMVADEHPRPEVTAGELGALKPVFAEDGTVTAGNSSGINDGAAMVVLAEESLVLEQGWPVLCEWVGVEEVGCDPHRMGLGPVHALAGLLERHQLKLDDLDQLEINEAFASQVLACVRQLGLEAVALSGDVNRKRPAVNPHGGGDRRGASIVCERRKVGSASGVADCKTGIAHRSLCIVYRRRYGDRCTAAGGRWVVIGPIFPQETQRPALSTALGFECSIPRPRVHATPFPAEARGCVDRGRRCLQRLVSQNSAFAAGFTEP